MAETGNPVELTAAPTEKTVAVQPNSTAVQLEPAAVKDKSESKFVTMSETDYDHSHHSRHDHSQRGSAAQPSFAGDVTDNVTVVRRQFLSDDVVLPCKIFHMQEGTVSHSL